MKATFKLCLIGLASLMGVPTSALSQGYPNRAVKLLVGYPPSSSPDVIGRIMANQLSKILGQSFVIDNKPGAGATLATAIAASSPADGYTLLVAETAQMVIGPQVIKVSYDPIRDFTPIGLLTNTPVALVTNAATQIKTVQDLIREAKVKPGKINYASNGIGTLVHLQLEVFKNAAGVDLTHIPYKGSAQMLLATLTGEVQVDVASLSSLGPHVKSGKLNLLGVMSGVPIPSLPDLPMVSDLVKGYDGFSSDNGIVAPVGIPSEVVIKLSEALRVALKTPEAKDKLEELGFILTWSTPEAYAAHLRQELKKFERAIKISNIKRE